MTSDQFHALALELASQTRMSTEGSTIGEVERVDQFISFIRVATADGELQLELAFAPAPAVAPVAAPAAAEALEQ